MIEQGILQRYKDLSICRIKFGAFTIYMMFPAGRPEVGMRIELSIN